MDYQLFKEFILRDDCTGSFVISLLYMGFEMINGNEVEEFGVKYELWQYDPDVILHKTYVKFTPPDWEYPKITVECEGKTSINGFTLRSGVYSEKEFVELVKNLECLGELGFGLGSIYLVKKRLPVEGMNKMNMFSLHQQKLKTNRYHVHSKFEQDEDYCQHVYYTLKPVNAKYRLWS